MEARSTYWRNGPRRNGPRTDRRRGDGPLRGGRRRRGIRGGWPRPRAAAALALLVALLAVGCGRSAHSSTGGPGARIELTAAENFWGSIAAQLGGEKVAVTSVIVNPDTDPHSYEPTAADGVAMARSRMAIRSEER